eukprot:COSAG01_NODE_1796_length_9212_cov_45.060573_12_plen_54_part_00
MRSPEERGRGCGGGGAVAAAAGVGGARGVPSVLGSMGPDPRETQAVSAAHVVC